MGEQQSNGAIVLIVFAGLPSTGKTTLAARLAKGIVGAHIRIDTIGAALRRAGATPDPQGLADYLIAEAVAQTLLEAGVTVIIDAVNDSEKPRQQWRALAQRCGVPLRLIELTCNDPVEHRRRVERRSWDFHELRQPSWADIVGRKYEPWSQARLVLDTARPLGECAERVLAYVRADQSGLV